MLTDQTKEHILSFFTALLEGERKIEDARKALNLCCDFDPYILFNRLDYQRKSFLTEDNLLNFALLNKIEATVSQGKYVILFYDTNSKRCINYNEFLNLVLCNDFYTMRHNQLTQHQEQQQGSSNSNYMSYETENKFCELLRCEFELADTIDKIQADMKSYGDFSVAMVMNMLNGSNCCCLTYDAFEKYFGSNNCKVSKEDINGLFKRLDLKRNGKIDMSELEKIFYFPYSSPPSNTVSRSPSFMSGHNNNNNNNNNMMNRSYYNSQYSDSNNNNNNCNYQDNNNIQITNTNSNSNIINKNYNTKAKKHLQPIDTSNNNTLSLTSIPFKNQNQQNYSQYNNNNNNNNSSNSKHQHKLNTYNSIYSNNKSNYSTSHTISNTNYDNHNHIHPIYQYNSKPKHQYIPKHKFQYHPTTTPLTQQYHSKHLHTMHNTSNKTSTNINNNTTTPVRITKTLALRLSPTRALSPKNPQHHLSTRYLSREPTFTESNFISFIKLLMDTENEIEHKKIQLLCSCDDFNVEDAFSLFETPQTQNDTLTFNDIKQCFENKLNLYIDNDDIIILLNKYDLSNDGGISYSNFFDMVVPFDKDNRDDVESRPSKGELSRLTLSNVKDYICYVIESERKIDVYRSKVREMKGFNVEKIYKESIDMYNYGFIKNEDLEGYLNKKRIQYEQKEVDLLYIRLDRNRDGKVKCEDFVKELTPVIDYSE